MGLNRQLANLPDAITTDTSNNVGIGGSPSGSYKLDVTGTGRFSSTLITSDSLLVNATSQNGTFAKIYARQSTDSSFYGINLVSASAAQYVGGMWLDSSGVLTFGQSYLAGGGSYQAVAFTTSGVTRFTIASTGAATFSSSVYAAQGIFSSDFTQNETSKVGISFASGYGQINSWGANTSTFGGLKFQLSASNGNTFNALTISPSGNVNISGSASTNTRLTVTGADATSSNYSIVCSDSTTANLFYVRNDGLILTGASASSPTNLTNSALPNVFVGTSGILYKSTTSSIRHKQNINDWTGSGLDTILALKTKTFTYKESYYKYPELEMLGLIAEEVAEVSPFLAEYENEDRTGQVENVRYANIVVPLIKAIQEMNTKIDEQNQTIQSLQEQINILAK